MGCVPVSCDTAAVSGTGITSCQCLACEQHNTHTYKHTQLAVEAGEQKDKTQEQLTELVQIIEESTRMQQQQVCVCPFYVCF